MLLSAAVAADPAAGLGTGVTMSFMNPIFLAALAAVAIPIIVHMLSRRRVPVVYFSSLRFLKPSDRRSMRRINLRRLFLLVLRTMGVALVVLAFSRPVVKGGLAALFPGGGALSGCVLVDRSYSMGVDEEEGSLFGRAKRSVLEILEGFTNEDDVTLILFDSGQELYYRGRGDARAAGGLLEGAGLSWSTTDLRAAVGTGLDALRRSGRGIRELYIVSDFQRSAITAHVGRDRSSAGTVSGEETGEDPSRGKRQEMPFRAYLVPIYAEEVQNVSIEQVKTPRVTLHQGELASLEVLIRNGSRKVQARFPVEVYLDGRRILEREIELEPAAVTRESFMFPVERSGWIRGEVRKRSDRLRADDIRYFTLRVIDRVRVLLLADERAMYLEQAMCPEGADGDIELVRKRWRDLTSRDLEAADVLLLGPGDGPFRRDITLIERFVAGGGRAVVLILPELADAIRTMSRHPLSIRIEETGAGFVSLDRPLSPPDILAPLDDDDLEAITRLRFRRFAAVAGVAPGDVLLRFATGSPFLWKEERGAGSYIFCAIDPTPEAGDLVLSPYFLPILQQAVLAGGSQAGPGDEKGVGESIVWDGGRTGGVRYELPGEGSGGGPRIGVPSLSGVGGTGSGAGAERIVIPPAGVPGFAILYGDADTIGVFAVNVECGAESDLFPASGDEAADSLGLEHFVVAGEGVPLSETVRSAREGREITLVLVCAAIAVFVAESVLSQRRYEGDEGVG